MDVVVVESPAKAKTINKYLGSGYQVLASYGHVRDLPPKDGSVQPDQDFSMSWEVQPASKKRIDAIAKALRGAKRLFLATDPDREGEAISWHVQQVLEDQKALRGVEVKRVVFHEVTKKAVLDAIAHPRDLNRELVEAYLARRALDYLVGFTLSPVLWRKLPGARSAGRVQSVALRLICEREAEIEAFKSQEYWSIHASFTTQRNEPFTARLTHLNGTKLDRQDIGTEEAARTAAAAIRARSYRIAEIERKTVRRHPAPPFTTSTLQQEASRKLGFGATKTMRVAQQLYEGVAIGGDTVGLITYMRTDSVTLSQEAIDGCRRLIAHDYDVRYLPDKPRLYRTKAKNAQEAHEAIRPTDMFRRPDDVARALDNDQRRLYELIWKRTVACEMESAVLDQVAVDVGSPDGKVVLRANGSVLRFDGFLTLYQEGRDDSDDDESGDRRLPAMEKGEETALVDVTSDQHFTQPPPRYSEASLVKGMEELGIGRPSTYAQIIRVLQERNYVRLERRRFMPEDRGRLVTGFLVGFFRRYVEYDFTAHLEEQLDDISGGRIDWKKVLHEFWNAFVAAVGEAKDLTIREVLETLDRDLGPHFFQVEPGQDPEAARRCPSCSNGRLTLKTGRYGAFIGCSNYPECRYTRQIGGEAEDKEQAEPEAGGLEYPRILGTDPASGEDVALRKGPYGVYIQLGEAKPAEKGKKAPPKPKRAALPKGTQPPAVTLELALRLLSLPRDLGTHPETNQPISAGIGRFGPYLRHGPAYVSLPADDDVLTIGLNRAVAVLADSNKRGGRELGTHPVDGTPVTVQRGRFGPYVKHGKVNATIPRDIDPESITLDEALVLIAERAARSGKGKTDETAVAKPAKQIARKPAKAKAPAKGHAKAAGAKAGKTRRPAPKS